MRPIALVLLCGLVGCQTPPAVVAPAEPKPTPTIRLCQHEVTADATAIQGQLAPIVGPGLPIEVARARLIEVGFRVFGWMPKAYRQSGNADVNRVTFIASFDEVGAWGQRYFEVRVHLYFDESLTVTEVKIPDLPAKAQMTRFAWYFARRPDLREPLGLPIEETRTVMEANGFRCTLVEANGRAAPRPHLYCRALAETPLGGSVIRIHLFWDEAGKVNDTIILKEVNPFDEFLCMLPDQGDTLSHALVKTVLFPVRLYTALAIAGLEADLAMGRP